MIEGIPDGWELVRIGPVTYGEWRLMDNGKVMQWTTSLPSIGWAVVLRKTEKPKQYRPFANAAEAMPFWDAKLTPKDKGPGVLRVYAMGDDNVGIGFTLYTYRQAFEKYECDDGSPFGVEVQS